MAAREADPGRIKIGIQRKGDRQVERKARQPGPDPEVVKIEGGLEESVRKALEKGKPVKQAGHQADKGRSP